MNCLCEDLNFSFSLGRPYLKLVINVSVAWDFKFVCFFKRRYIDHKLVNDDTRLKLHCKQQLVAGVAGLNAVSAKIAKRKNYFSHFNHEY